MTMEALFGFMGRYDEKKFEAMRRQLSHRGKSNLEKYTGGHFNFFYFDNYNIKKPKRAIDGEGQVKIALAGTVYGEDGSVLAASDLTSL